jgi:serine/threonine-protein kinase RCK2
MDSPLLMGMANPSRSPGVSALKEAFDITYAVHRMEEEGNRRKGFLVGVNEEDEDDEDAIMVDHAKQRQANGYARGVDPRNTAFSNRDAGRAGPRDRGDGKRNFELNMGAATLLG